MKRMHTRFIILGMERLAENNQLKIQVIMGQELRAYNLTRRYIGMSIPSELTSVTGETADRARRFSQLIHSFYDDEDEDMEFPIDLSNI